MNIETFNKTVNKFINKKYFLFRKSNYFAGLKSNVLPKFE